MSDDDARRGSKSRWSAYLRVALEYRVARRLALHLLGALSARDPMITLRRPTVAGGPFSPDTSASNPIIGKDMETFERPKAGVPSEEPMGIIISGGAAVQVSPRLLAYVYGEAPTKDEPRSRDKVG